MITSSGRRGSDGTTSEQGRSPGLHDPLQGRLGRLRRLGLSWRRGRQLGPLPQHRLRLAHHRAHSGLPLRRLHARLPAVHRRLRERKKERERERDRERARR